MTYYDLLMVLVVMILLLSEASPASVPSRHGRFCLAGIFAVVEPVEDCCHILGFQIPGKSWTSWLELRRATLVSRLDRRFCFPLPPGPSFSSFS